MVSIHTALPQAEDAEAEFLRFKRGEAVTGWQVARLLRDHGVAGECTDIRYGYHRKILARLRQADGTHRIAKIAMHSHSKSLLRREALGYAAARQGLAEDYGLVRFELVADTSSYVIALMGEAEGRPLGRRAALTPPPPPFPRSTDSRKLRAHLDGLLNELEAGQDRNRLTVIAEGLARGYGDVDLALFPSHGDFLYWNLMRAPDGRLAVLDFEYFSAGRAPGFDLWQWVVLPLARRCVRGRMEAAFPRLLVPLALRLWGPRIRRQCLDGGTVGNLPGRAALGLLMALYMFDHAVTMAREHQLPDILSLIGRDDHALRTRLIALYCHGAGNGAGNG